MKKYIVSVFIIVFAIAVIFLLSNRFSSVIHRTGLDIEYYEIHVEDIDSNGDKFRIVRIDTSDNKVALAWLTRDSAFSWTVTQLKLEKEYEAGFVSIGWIQSGGIRRFEALTDPIFGKEWHFIYAGNNAIKLIDIPHESIPSNITVNVQQARNDYMLHVISFADPDTINQFNIRDILLSGLFITEQ